MKTKRNFARILAVLLTLAMLTCVVGCAKENNTTGTKGDTQGTTVAPNNGTTSGDNTGTTASEDDEPELYVVSGVWKFNEKLTFPKMTEENSSWDCWESLNFTSNRKKYDGEINVTTWWYMDGTTCFVLAYHASGEFEADHAYEVFDSVPARWTNEGYRTVDFGEYPQEVSKGFYEWFVANAKKVSA